MSTVTFDTFKFVERLEKAGLSREQAAAIVEAQADSLAQALDTTLATKSDISRIDIGLTEVMGELRLNRWMLAALLGVAIANFAKQFF